MALINFTFDVLIMTSTKEHWRSLYCGVTIGCLQSFASFFFSSKTRRLQKPLTEEKVFIVKEVVPKKILKLDRDSLKAGYFLEGNLADCSCCFQADKKIYLKNQNLSSSGAQEYNKSILCLS